MIGGDIKIIWIAWERHRRTLELKEIFSAKLYIFESSKPRFLKHPWFLLNTWKVIHSENPNILIIQNPSVVLAIFACLIKPIYRYKLTIDSHNSGIIPPNRLVDYFKTLLRFVQRKADITIVTNDCLSEVVKKNGGTPFVLPDKIPITGPVKKNIRRKASFLFICTFEADEPYLELIKAASKIREALFYITGDLKKRKKSLCKGKPDNVIFTGFLPEDEYWAMLSSVNFVIDLTKRENCLVCGAYESIAAETPMILSDSKALRKYFYKGAVYTLNDADSIAKAIMDALRQEQKLKCEIKELKYELSLSWQSQAEKLLKYLN